MGDKSTFDYIDRLIVQTLFPIGLSIGIAIAYYCHYLYLLGKHLKWVKEAKESKAALVDAKEQEYTMSSNSTKAHLDLEVEMGITFKHEDKHVELMDTLEEMKFEKNLSLIKQKYFTVFLLLTYLILPTVTTNIAGAIPCSSVNPDSIEVDVAEVSTNYDR